MTQFPLIKVTILYAGGIILQKYIQSGFEVLLLSGIFLFFISTVILLFSKKTFLPVSLFIGLCILFTGAISYQMAILKLLPYPFNTPKMKDIAVTGQVVSMQLKSENEFRIALNADSLHIKGNAVQCKMTLLCKIKDESARCSDSLYNKIHIGNYVSISGTLSKAREQRNPWEFDFNRYLFDNGYSGLFSCVSVKNVTFHSNAASTISDAIFSVRKAVDKRITELHTPDCAALLRGLLLADRSEINDEIETDFINTGVVHILAVSGSNVLLMILIFSFFFGRMGLYLKLLLIGAGLILFLAVTGITASVFRAVLMASILMIAFICNRSSNTYNAVFLSALIILAIYPLQLFDPGFQLSYSAVIAIIFINPRIMKLFENCNLGRNGIVSFFMIFTSVTLSAQIGTLPFTLFYFGKLSIISIVSNLIIVPMISVITGSAVFTLLISPFWQWGTAIYAGANSALTQIVYSAIHSLSNLKYSFLYIRDFTLYDSICYYFFLSLFFIVSPPVFELHE